MKAARVILQQDQFGAGALEVFATRGQIGSVTERKQFPRGATAEALLYARGIAKRLECPMVDRTAVVAPPAIVVKVDAFDLGFDCEAPGPEHDNPSKHFAKKVDALAYAARIGAERGWIVDDRAGESVSFTIA